MLRPNVQEIRSLALEVAWSSDGSCVEARAAVPLQAGLHLCQGLLLPGSEAEEVLILAGSACLAALHHAQQTGPLHPIRAHKICGSMEHLLHCTSS